MFVRVSVDLQPPLDVCTSTFSAGMVPQSQDVMTAPAAVAPLIWYTSDRNVTVSPAFTVWAYLTSYSSPVPLPAPVISMYEIGAPMTRTF